MGEALTATPPTGLDAGAIVAIIIVIVVLLVLVVVAVVLVLLWKYCNDTFNVYICPCLNRKTTRSRVHSLEQENQRLRQELSQLKMARPDKLSMSFSRGELHCTLQAMCLALNGCGEGVAVGWCVCTSLMMSHWWE